MDTGLKRLIKQAEESPFYKLLNMKIEVAREDYALLSIMIEEKHLQFLQTVHGGVLASLADSAAAWPILSSGSLRDIPVTVEMKINFLKPVVMGKLIAEARVIHRGSKVFVCDVEVKDYRNSLIAKSLVTYYLVSGDRGKNTI